MAHQVVSYDDGERPIRRWPSMRPLRSGFTIVEMLGVLAIASVLMLIGAPALLNILAHYKVHSSAQQLVMLGRHARFESIKLNQPVTLYVDTNRMAVYVVSGTLPGPTPYTFPHGQTDIPPTQLVASWSIPRGVAVAMVPAAACTPGSYCQSFQYSSDGSGTGVPVVFSTPNQLSSKVTMATPSTGRLVIQQF